MGCGCKDTVNKETGEVIKEPITVKLVLNKIASTLMMTLLLLILTPFMVLVIWYYGIGNIYGTKLDMSNIIGYIRNKGVIEEENEEEIDEDEDDYEVIGVDVIK